jgi:predicted 3-demethylubiquinone-9 3-methyltransferase (glyoxalase superfamily)
MGPPKVRTCLYFERGGYAADQTVVEFTLAAAPMMILTDGPMFRLSQAVSISGLTKGQAETDRFGVSWQITPGRLMQMSTSPGLAAAGRARAGMMSMRKIDIAALEAVFAG